MWDNPGCISTGCFRRPGQSGQREPAVPEWGRAVSENANQRWQSVFTQGAKGFEGPTRPGWAKKAGAEAIEHLRQRRGGWGAFCSEHVESFQCGIGA